MNWWRRCCIQVHCIFLKVCKTFCFYERPTLASVFVKKNKSEEDFYFYKKRQNVKVVFSIYLTASPQRWHVPQAAKSVTAKLSWELHFVSQHQAPCHSFELCLCAFVLYLDLFWAAFFARSVCSRYQKSQEEATYWVWECSKNLPYKWMVTAFLIYAIWVYRRFHRIVDKTFIYTMEYYLATRKEVIYHLWQHGWILRALC